MTGEGLILGCVLAGGRSTRMGGSEKPLMMLAGRSLLDRALDRLRPQVGALAISSNGAAADYGRAGVPVLPDRTGDRRGPLAGLLAGLDHAEAIGAVAVVTVAADTPFFPRDLVAALSAAAGGETVAVAESQSGPHPTFALWPVGLRGDLEAVLARGYELRVRRFVERHPNRPVHFPPMRDGVTVADPFFNVNTPGDLVVAAAIAEWADRLEDPV